MPCRSALLFQPAVLEDLISTGHLGQRELLSLRVRPGTLPCKWLVLFSREVILQGTCKQLFTRLTGALPAYLEHRLPERYPSTAVCCSSLLKGAGLRKMAQLIVFSRSLVCAPRSGSCIVSLAPRSSGFGQYRYTCHAWTPLQHLQELHLELVEGLRHNKQFPRLYAVDVAPLEPLPHLHSLSVNSSVGRAVHAEQLRQLLPLRALSLNNVVASLLPPSLSALSLQASPEVLLPANAGAPLVVYSGSLHMLWVHMPLFGNDPRSLRKNTSLQHVVELHLHFHFWEPTRSRWCPGLSCLQVLHIYHLHPCNYLRPSWDLCTCTSLAELHLHIHASSELCLRGIVNVRAQVVTMDLQSIASGQERCSLDCGSWSLAQAEVTYAKHAGFAGRFPLCVSDAVGALMCTQGDPPAVKVNGMSPAQAAAAVAGADQLERALREALGHASDDWESEDPDDSGCGG